jgi:formate/nitrite transporter FocA (FNT family)
MWSQAQHILGCYLILLGPVLLYHNFTQRKDAIFWSLLAYGAFFFPMGLLACIMFDSIRGLNPILLIPSIFSTFFHYFGLVLLIVAIILAFSALSSMDTDNPETRQSPEQHQPPKISALVVGGIFAGIVVYIAFVIAHVIGRFYWRHQEKLNWEV